MKRYIHTEIETARDIRQVLSQGHLFEMAVERVMHDGIGTADRHAWLCAVAAYCHDLGVDEENVCQFAANHIGALRMDSATGQEAAITVANTYRMQRGTFGACHTMPAVQRKQFLLTDFLARNYRLRYNVMTRQTEYADLYAIRATFLPLTDRVTYQIKERAAMAGIALTDNEMKNRLASQSVRDFCPMEDFLDRLPRWDGTRRIHRLAETIPTDDRDWPERFYRWFLSMVGHWHMPDARFANSIIPVLVGPQGCGKSQFIRSLLPVEMWPYYHDGFDLRRRSEAEQMMTRYGLINIDEFDAISPRQEPVLKHLVQLTEVHADGQPARRFASFIATSNHRELHRDTSGSRRYIFVDVKGDIRLNHRLSLLQIYAEAVHDIRNDERTWFTKAEEAQMQTSNEDFREQDISEQLFLMYYEPLPTRQPVEGGEWLSAMQIYQNIERLSKKDLGITRANRFGRILTKHCGKQGSKFGDSTRLYHVKCRLT